MLAPPCSPSPTSPKVATSSVLDAIAAAFGPGLIHCSADPDPPPRGVHAHRPPRASCTRRCWPGRGRRSRGSTSTRTRASTRAWASSTSRRSSTSIASERGAACAEALVLADELGQLGVPVYLYGELAGGRTRAELRRDLSPFSARLRAREPPHGGRDAGRRAAAAGRVQRRGRRAARDRQGDRARAARDARRARARAAGRARAGLDQHRERGAPPAEVVEAVRAHAPVIGAELVAPAPRAALAGFPDDVPLRGPKPLEDHLLS